MRAVFLHLNEKNALNALATDAPYLFALPQLFHLSQMQVENFDRFTSNFYFFILSNSKKKQSTTLVCNYSTFKA